MSNSHNWLTRLAWLLSISLSLTAKAESDGSIQLSTVKDAKGIVTAMECRGITPVEKSALSKWSTDDERWSKIFPIQVVTAGSADVSAVPTTLGNYEVVEQSIRFRPAFPFRPGVTYRATFDRSSLQSETLSTKPEKDAPRIQRDFAIPDLRPNSASKLVTVFPSAREVPENLLRFYLQFSAPMSRGDAYANIKLLDAAGNVVDQSFLEIGEELWDVTGTRLTLLIEPGRIKRGLRPREELGPVLEAGKQYTLEVSPNWRDATGSKLVDGYRKTFRVTKPREVAIDESAWKVSGPRAGTRDPVVIQFPYPLDRALLERTIAVRTSNQRATSRVVDGTVVVGKSEDSWTFKPDQEWGAGKYHLLVNTTLEDSCGNRIGRPFEVDELKPVERPVDDEFIEIPFDVAP